MQGRTILQVRFKQTSKFLRVFVAVWVMAHLMLRMMRNRLSIVMNFTEVIVRVRFERSPFPLR